MDNRHTKFPWDECAHQIISHFNLKKLTAGEWHGSCPNCGGKDRFWINEYNGEVKVKCRQCDDFRTIFKIFRERGIGQTLSYQKPEPFRLREEGKTHPYHTRKGVELGDATLEGDMVVIPLKNPQGDYVGTQTINPNGDKRFSVGLVKDGASHLIGGPISDKVFYAEGWATAASVHIATGKPCVFSLDASNLPNVVLNYKERFQNAEHIVAADNDPKGLAAAKASGCAYVVPKLLGDDWNDVFLTQGAQETGTLLNAKPNSPKKLLTRYEDLIITPPEYQIDEVLEKKAFVLLIGASGSGKTFAALDMACSIASGTPYHGKAVERGRVVSINGEGTRGIGGRIEAWCTDRGVDAGNLNLYLSGKAIVLTDPKSLDDLKVELSTYSPSPDLIIIDTLARAFGGLDENTSQDMGKIISVCDNLIAEYGCAVMCVHHTGHKNSDRARGSSSLHAAADAVYLVEKLSQHGITLRCQKMKDAPIPPEMQFIKVVVEPSVILQQVPTFEGSKKPKLTEQEKMAIKIFEELTDFGKKGKSLHIEDWRPEFRKRHTGDNMNSKDKAFGRVRKSLVSKEILQVDDDVYTLNDITTK